MTRDQHSYFKLNKTYQKKQAMFENVCDYKALYSVKKSSCKSYS